MLTTGRERLRRRLNRGHLHAALAGVVLAQAVYILWWVWQLVRAPFSEGDWRTYLAVVSMLRDGRGTLIYDQSVLATVEQALGFDRLLPYPYHPAFLLVVYPFALLPPGLSYVAWTVLNIAVVALVCYLLARAFVPTGERKAYALLAFSSLHLAFALRQGQSSCLLLLAMTLATLGMLRGSDRQTGLALSAMLIKPQLLPLYLLWLLWYRRLRALLWFVAGGGLVLAASILMVGLDWIPSYWHLLTSGTMSFAYPWSHTLLGLAYVSVGSQAAWPLYALLALGVGALYVLCLHRTPGGAVELQRVLLSAASVGALLLTPYLFVYDLILLALPTALSWVTLTRGRGRYLLAAGFVAPAISQAPILTQYQAAFVWTTVGVSLIAYGLLVRRLLAKRTCD